LVFDERVNVRIREHLARALAPLAAGNVAERAGRDVAEQRLDRAAQPRCGFVWRAQGIDGQRNARGIAHRDSETTHGQLKTACAPDPRLSLLQGWRRVIGRYPRAVRRET
jgi:hypothetical protein